MKVNEEIDRRVPRVERSVTAAKPLPIHEPKGRHTRRSKAMANNWEYHQDQRDKAMALGAIIVVGGFALVGAAIVTLIILSIIWQP